MQEESKGFGNPNGVLFNEHCYKAAIPQALTSIVTIPSKTTRLFPLTW